MLGPSMCRVQTCRIVLVSQRFDDMYSKQYQALFQLNENANLRILEIGCEPHALTGVSSPVSES